MILASAQCMRTPDNMIKWSVLYLVIFLNTPYLTIHVNISQYTGFLQGLSGKGNLFKRGSVTVAKSTIKAEGRQVQ